MDSPNPYSQRSKFMDLLHDQQENHYPQNIPYRFSQFIPVGASQSQCPDDPTLDEEEVKERKRWGKTEDVVLISCWLNTSKDSIKSNEQKSGTFWNRIAAMYADSPSIPADEKRE
ncbi:hypothetical protein AALP_AAs66013U000100, partial [Arabis alpina]